MLLKRIDYELHQRIVHPWLTRSNWKWQGFDGKRVNNWNPWINTNLLQTCLLAMDDVKTRSEMLTKVIKSIDHWINWQPNDGGCDEGPSYWGLSVGEFATFLDLLSSASAGKISWLNNVNTTLFHRMGRYIAVMHIDKNRFVNFGDAEAFLVPQPGEVYRYGKIFNDQSMKDLAAYFESLLEQDHEVGLSQMGNLQIL